MNFNKKRIVQFIIIFLLLLYKYLCMWFKNLNNYFSLIVIFVMILSIFFLLKEDYSKGVIKKIIIIIIFYLITAYVVGTIDIIVSLLFALLFYKEKDGEKNFLKMFITISAVLFCSTIFLYCIGILNNVSSRRLVNGEMMGRYSLGFSHVNAVFMYFLPIILGYLYLNNEHINIKLFLAIVDIISLILYKYSLCRTGIILVILINIFIIFRKILFTSKVFKFIIKHSYFIFGILSIVIAYQVGNDFNSSINKLLSYRPYYVLLNLERFGIHFLGYGVNNVLAFNIMMDNGYMTILLAYGLISYIFYYYFHLKAFNDFSKNYFYLIVLSIFSFYMIFENDVLYSTNFILTIEFIMFLRDSSKKGVKYIDED